MPKSPIEELAEAALARLQKPYTEDVTHDVFEAIETDQALRRGYNELCTSGTVQANCPANTTSTRRSRLG